MRSARWGLFLVLLAVLLFPKSAAAAPFIGLPFRIDDTMWGGEVAAACNPGRRVCLVVWSDSDNSLRYRFLSEDGRMLGSGSEGLSMGYGPDIAYNAASDQFLVVWAYEYTRTDTDIIAARIYGDGAGSPRVFKITGTYDQDLSPRVDTAGAQGFLVVFERSATLNQILGQRVSADGVGGDLLGGTFGIGPLTTYQWLADVAYSPAALAYAVPYHTRQEVRLQLVSTAGALLGSVQDFGEGERVSVAGDFGDPSRPFLLTYLDVIGPSPPYAFAVRGYFVGSIGEPLQPSMVLSTDFTDAAPVTRGPGAFGVAWCQRDISQNIWVQLVRPNGAMEPAHNASAADYDVANQDEQRPELASGAGRSLVLWIGYAEGSVGLYGRWFTTGYTFAGQVRKGTPMTGSPLAGVTVQLYGDNDASLFTGPPVLIAETTTAADGSFEITYGPGYDYTHFHVVEVDPPGTVSTEATAPAPGAPNPANLTTVTYSGPLELGYYPDIAFWDRQTPPEARFTVTPASGPVSTNFTFDAQATTDAEEPLGSLVCRWDWENDGTYDTDWSSSCWVQHRYATAGTRTVRLQVKDSSGLTGTATRSVTVTVPVALTATGTATVVPTATPKPTKTPVPPAAKSGVRLPLVFVNR